VSRLELDIIAAQAESIVQRVAEDEPVDAANCQFVCALAPEFRWIDERLRVPADFRGDVPLEAESLVFGTVPSRATSHWM